MRATVCDNDNRTVLGGPADGSRCSKEHEEVLVSCDARGAVQEPILAQEIKNGDVIGWPGGFVSRVLGQLLNDHICELGCLRLQFVAA